MRRLLHLSFCVLFALLLPASARERSVRTLSRAALEDKVRGGWAGQVIGVSYGAPTEFRYLAKTIPGDLPWSPDRVNNAIDQDDLYVEMTFARVMDIAGIDATTEQFGAAFRDSEYQLWHANAGARRLLNQGVRAGDSGHPRYNIHANDIDFQIESDFIGLMCPGLPRESNYFCDRVGRVMNYGDGVYGGMFVCGMYSAAFFESDPRRIVEAGLACIPAQSGYGRILRDVLDWSARETDWQRVWQQVEDKWDREDPCPGGVLQPFNIDAKLNGAYIAIGLLFGKGDFARTLEITTRCGQDSDCNPSSAAGVLGVVLGYERIPEEWKRGIAAIADKKFSYTQYSFQDIVRSTMERAEKVVARAGGRLDRDQAVIPVQTPRAPKLEQWDMGVPERLVKTSDVDWTWTGDWKTQPGNADRTRFEGRVSTTSGAEAELRFEGSAVLLIGNCSQDGGRADVFLDGKKAGTLDAYIVPRTHDQGLWHTYGLTDGPHVLRLVTRPDANARSTGQKVLVLAAVPFHTRK